jgi:hypothetical protein
MMSIQHFVTTGANGVDVVVAFDESRDNPVLMADSRHPHFSAIVDAIKAGDTSVFDLFDVGTGVAKRFEQITDRVSYDGRQILFDGDPIHNALADQVQRALEAGEQSYLPLAKFWEKLASNPNEHSKTQAYDWLAAHKFQITEDGDVVGYKGVHTSGSGEYISTWASQVPSTPSAFVDGVPVPPLSKVPNRLGTVVTLPRSEVKHDPNVACSRGLHVSTHSYAESYVRGTVLEVHVNPRDIVSVPKDGRGEKVRVCRYKIARVAVDNNGNAPVLRADSKSTWVGDVGYSV